jgi:hypothetical protein
LVWLPLGQQPNVDKVRNMLCSQLERGELSDELTLEEKRSEIRAAMLGKDVLLVLDGKKLNVLVTGIKMSMC